MAGVPIGESPNFAGPDFWRERFSGETKNAHAHFSRGAKTRMRTKVAYHWLLGDGFFVPY